MTKYFVILVLFSLYAGACSMEKSIKRSPNRSGVSVHNAKIAYSNDIVNVYRNNMGLLVSYNHLTGSLDHPSSWHVEEDVSSMASYIMTEHPTSVVRCPRVQTKTNDVSQLDIQSVIELRRIFERGVGRSGQKPCAKIDD